MLKDKTLDELLAEIGTALKVKEQAERARVDAEFKKRKSHYNYQKLMECLMNKEYVM